MVVLVPSAAQAVGEAKGAPSEVAVQPATEVIPLSVSEQTELPAALVASTTAGVV